MPKKSLQEQIETTQESEEPLQSPGQKGLSGKVVKSRSGGRRKSYTMDLRIHSPENLGCMSIDGIDTAPALVRLARVKGIDVIAVTDFYSVDFLDRVQEAARDSSVCVLPGVMIRCAVDSCNDVILSCLFQEGTTSGDVQDFLGALQVPSSASGREDYFIKLPFEEVLRLCEEHQVIALPSRMDKTPYRFSAIPTLVEDYGFRAFDLAYQDSKMFFKQRWPKVRFQLFQSSNANALAQIGSRSSKVKMATPGFAGLRDIASRENISL